MTTKYTPVTHITLIATGAPHIWLFDSDSRSSQFTYGWNDPVGGPETLRRYAEVWQRLTPKHGELRGRGYAPGLKIRYADQDCKPFEFETEISTPHRITTARATSNRYFAAKGSTAFGTYNGQSWMMHWVTGECKQIENLSMVDGRIFFTRNGVEFGYRWNGPFYDYLTGKPITNDPQPTLAPTPDFREEDEDDEDDQGCPHCGSHTCNTWDCQQ